MYVGPYTNFHRIHEILKESMATQKQLNSMLSQQSEFPEPYFVNKKAARDYAALIKPAEPVLKPEQIAFLKKSLSLDTYV